MLTLKKYRFLLFGVFFLSCSSVYKTSVFDEKTAPQPPDYSNQNSWAVLPNHFPAALTNIVGEYQERAADVFYVYPTLFSNKKDERWNADIYKEEIREEVISKAVAFQASAWTKAANLYVPFYRQAHYRIFVDPYAQKGIGAGELAYSDVKKAFQYYLDHYNQGKPIIIASHSQGSLHAKRLLQDFFDEKPLQSKLIAAYLVGVKITPDMFATIKPLNSPKAIGGFVSWNTYKKNHLPDRYEYWYKGAVVSNPITWNDSEWGEEAQHLGVLYSDNKVYPQSITLQRIDGMLWATVPRVPKRFFLSFVKNYHFADINLFWGNIQQNAMDRTQQWFSLQNN